MDGTNKEETIIDENGLPIVRYKFKERNNMRDYLDKTYKKTKHDDVKDLIMAKMDILNSVNPKKSVKVLLIDESEHAKRPSLEWSHSISDSDQSESFSELAGDIKGRLNSLNRYFTGSSEIKSSQSTYSEDKRPENIELVYNTYDPVSNDTRIGARYSDGLIVTGVYKDRREQLVDVKVVYNRKLD